MTHSGRSRSSDCCEDHGAAFGHRASNRKTWNVSIFSSAKGGRIATGAEQNVELDISSNHLSELDLGGNATLFERC
jgi:hypothetical protein